MSRSNLDSDNSTNIPVPQEFIKDFKTFFKKPQDLANYDFLLGLNRYDSSSIWKEPDMQVTELNNEKPIGMKTLDHYFSKKSSSNVKKHQKSNIDDRSESKSPDSSARKSPDSSARKSPDNSKRKSRGSSKSKSPDSNILSQDIFNRNDSVSSHEYSRQNHDTSEEREVVPCTQYNDDKVSKFNSSNLLSSGQTNQSSSESDDDKKSRNRVINKQNKQTNILSLGGKTKKSSKSTKKNSSDGDQNEKVTKSKPNILANSPSKRNLSVINKSGEKESSHGSSSSEEQHNSSMNSKKSSRFDKRAVRSPPKSNLSGNSNKPLNKKSSDSSSSSSDEEDRVISPVKTQQISASSPLKTNLNKSLSKRSSDDTCGSSSVKIRNSQTMITPSTSSNKAKNTSSSDSSSSSDEESASDMNKANVETRKVPDSQQKGNLLVSNRPKNKKSSDDSSTEDENKGNSSAKMNSSIGKSQQKINSLLPANKSKDNSSDESSSDDEDIGNSSIGKAQLKVNSSALNKSKDGSSGGTSSSSDEQPPMHTGKEIKKPVFKSKDTKSSDNSSSSDDCNSSMKVNVSVQKPNSSLNLNKSNGRCSSDSSSSSDDCNSSMKVNVSVQKPNPSLNLNKSNGRSSNDSSSSSDEESPTQTNKSFSNQSKNKKSSDYEVKHRASVKMNPSGKPSVIDHQLMKLNKSKEKKSSSGSSSSDDESKSDSLQKLNLSKEKRKGLFSTNERDKSAESVDNKIRKKGISSSDNQAQPKSQLHRKNDDSSSSSDDENDDRLSSSVRTKKSNPKGPSDFDNNSKLKDKILKETIKKNMKTNSDLSGSSDDNIEIGKNALISGKNKGKKSLDDSSDSGAYSFKNKDVGKLLGLNTIGSNRNMSCASSVKSLASKPTLNVVPPKSTRKPSSTQDSESDSSSSDDDQKTQKYENKISESTIFAPAASSSFIFSTPDVLLTNKMRLNKVETVNKPHNKMEPAARDQLKENLKRKWSSVSDSDNEDEKTVIDRGKNILKRKRSSVSDSDNADEKTVIDRGKNLLKRKRDSVSDSDGSDKSSKVEEKTVIDRHREISKRKRTSSKSDELGLLESKMDVDQAQSSTDVPPKKITKELKIENKNWLENIIKNKKQIRVHDRLAIENSICFEDITDEDEIYSLQCPKELKIESLIGKKISLKGDSVFDVLTKDGEKMSFESFAVSIPSRINLLLPSRVNSSFKLGGFEVEGSIVLSEQCVVPQVDASAFSSTGKESSSEDELATSTPLPSGLKLRHPLHGLDYKNKFQPDFDLVLSKEEKRKKKRKKHQQGNKDEEFKIPSVPVGTSTTSGESIKLSKKESKKGIVIGRNLISLVSDDESRKSLKEELKKKKKKKHLGDKGDQLEIPSVPVSSSENSGESTKLTKKGIVIGRNMISLVTDDESRKTHKEELKKKKKKKHLAVENYEDETQLKKKKKHLAVEEGEDETQLKKKKKKKKEKDLD